MLFWSPTKLLFILRCGLGVKTGFLNHAVVCWDSFNVRFSPVLVLNIEHTASLQSIKSSSWLLKNREDRSVWLQGDVKGFTVSKRSSKQSIFLTQKPMANMDRKPISHDACLKKFEKDIEFLHVFTRSKTWSVSRNFNPFTRYCNLQTWVSTKHLKVVQLMLLQKCNVHGYFDVLS